MIFMFLLLALTESPSKILAIKREILRVINYCCFMTLCWWFFWLFIDFYAKMILSWYHVVCQVLCCSKLRTIIGYKFPFINQQLRYMKRNLIKVLCTFYGWSALFSALNKYSSSSAWAWHEPNLLINFKLTQNERKLCLWIYAFSKTLFSLAINYPTWFF